jgi:hypothetical protein
LLEANKHTPGIKEFKQKAQIIMSLFYSLLGEGRIFGGNEVCV